MNPVSPTPTPPTVAPIPAPRVLDWARAGGQRCRQLVAGLSDAAAAAPSRLPGWSRGHLVTHLARNADALLNLLSWARTGLPRPMYADAGQRCADIAAGAGRPARDLAADLAAAEGRFTAALDSLSPQQWRVPVRTAQGREVPASQVPWLRVREVWVHAVDLDLGLSFADLPAALVDALLDEVTATFTARDPGWRLRLHATDRDRAWRTGTGTHATGGAAGMGVGGSVDLGGTAADLLAWLIGRAPGDRLRVTPGDESVPAPPPWI